MFYKHLATSSVSDFCSFINHYLTYWIWFSVVYTLIFHGMRHQWSKCGLTRRCRMSPQTQILTTTLTHTVVYVSTYDTRPRSIYFLPQYQRQRKYIQTQMKRNNTFVLFTYISAEFTLHIHAYLHTNFILAPKRLFREYMLRNKMKKKNLFTIYKSSVIKSI